MRSASLVLLVLLLVLGTMVGAATSPRDPITVEYSPSYVLLEPERGRVTLTITNEGDLPTRVALSLVEMDASRHLDGRFTVEFASLSPGQTLETDLIVWTVGDVASPDGKVKVDVLWGSNLTMDEDWNPTPGTVEGVWDEVLEVRDEPKPVYDPWVFGLVVALVAVVVIALLHLTRSTMGRTTGP